MKDMDAAQLGREFWDAADDALFDRAGAAAPFYLSKATMEAFAIKGGGPPYVRIGRRANPPRRVGALCPDAAGIGRLFKPRHLGRAAQPWQLGADHGVKQVS